MRSVFILTIRDHSDFGAIRHESAHANARDAHAYAEHIAIPEVQSRTDAEWHNSLDATVRELSFNPATSFAD